MKNTKTYRSSSFGTITSKKLNKLIQNLAFRTSSGDEIYFTDNRDPPARYDILKCFFSKEEKLRSIKVGSFDGTKPAAKQFYINDTTDLWVPQSQCNKPCMPGFRKTKIETVCCYNCTPCAEGEMSNTTERDGCIPKKIDFLSYEDTLGATLFVIALIFSFICAVILGVFIKYRETPIVRVNNRNLSFIIAFNATKPVSKLKKYVGTQLSIVLVIVCSLGEIVISVVWIVSSPSFSEADTLTDQDTIILLCNEGSNSFFFCIIGYMGTLALLSFIAAFLAKDFPDRFNEAKNITFSMLVFCSVWVTFVPAYLSSKGSRMVAVEIFAILSSSVGLLGCIFIPKCYVIFLTPKVNTRHTFVIRLLKNLG
ncbi:hypothetical protein XELAEV_18028348mg [Xenopus laevis]|uniref:G-protein coupled receptors family 3 profile domain-containing protein n=1 Tax=Xenopus laevis TaxID=8355 RepID=A0A974CZH5_XENLA|nr:hypothetical protein XELAEV_18028348mg [Xenopus laevis]